MKKNPFEIFTKDAKLALQIAEKEAKTVGLKYIGTEHLLLGILSVPKSLACSILLGVGVSFNNVKLVLRTTGNKTDQAVASAQISTYLAKVIEESVQISSKYQHTYIGTEHLLYSLLSNKKCAWSVVLENMHLHTDNLQKQVEDILSQVSNVDGKDISGPKSIEDFLSGLTGMLAWGVNPMGWHENKHKRNNVKNGQNDETVSKTPALDFFGQDLTEECKQWKLDPIIGRDEEIQRVINILNRKTKNNPVLIGEPGVGKTAIAEGFAQAIHNKDVPHSLINKKVIMLDLWELIAGTKFRWEFEERLKDVISEAVSEENDVILFIDELHTLVWAWASEGSLDAANILKPALSRWKIQVIWATTLDEYRKYIEKDKALERRFQTVMVDEPTEKDTIKILDWLKTTFEDFHNLNISKEAIETAVKLSKRYIFDRFLPDKAIDLIDEACAKKWGMSDSNKTKIKSLQRKLDKINKQKSAAVSRQEYKKAVILKRKQEKIQEDINLIIRPKNKVKRNITIKKDDIAEVISIMTGIPTQKVIKNEFSKLKELARQLESEIFGQSESIQEITKAIIRNRIWLTEHNRPIASFVFMGPTGVGKTELVKQLAKYVYEDKDALIKIDMSEFMEKHNVSRLIGATAGYIGHDEGWQLTEQVRRKPYAIVLFDEIEKAHPEVFNILFQVMEDWYLTDSKGKKVDFKNTVIVMTSNLWSEILTQEASKIGFAATIENKRELFDDFDEKSIEVKEQLKELFPPEFLNRIDKTLVFKPLTKKQIKKILEKQLNEFLSRLKEQNIEMEVSNVVLNALTKKAYNPDYWARWVRRIILEDIEDNVVDAIISKTIKDWDKVKLIRKKGKDDEFEVVKVIKK